MTTPRFAALAFFSTALLATAVSANAAQSVVVKAGVSCPGSYLKAGSGKNCQAAPDYSDIIYLGENSRKSCMPTHTRLNAGDSKWCVRYSIGY